MSASPILFAMFTMLLLFGPGCGKQPNEVESENAKAAGKDTANGEKQQPAAEPVALGKEELSGPTGRLLVKASEDFPVIVTDEEGLRIALGHCNKEWPLPPGEYIVSIDPDRFPEIEVGAVTVKKDEKAELQTAGFGRINVKASEIFHGGPSLVTQSGGKIALEHCNKEWTVPAGTYTLRFKFKDFPEKDLGTVTVEAGKTATATVTGFGRVNVKASEQYAGQVSLEGEDGTVIKVDHCNKEWVVPTGTYKVKVKSTVVEDVNVKEDETTQVDSGV